MSILENKCYRTILLACRALGQKSNRYRKAAVRMERGWKALISQIEDGVGMCQI